jgi:hypothetical protein
VGSETGCATGQVVKLSTGCVSSIYIRIPKKKSRFECVDRGHSPKSGHLRAYLSLSELPQGTGQSGSSVVALTVRIQTLNRLDGGGPRPRRLDLTVRASSILEAASELSVSPQPLFLRPSTSSACLSFPLVGPRPFVRWRLVFNHRCSCQNRHSNNLLGHKDGPLRLRRCACLSLSSCFCEFFLAQASAFTDYAYPCRHIPSLPTCNLFLRQLADRNLLPSGSNLSTAGVGVDPVCAIPRMGGASGQSGSLGNIANIIICVLSVIVALHFAWHAHRRQAAVARAELPVFYVIYALTLLFQLLDTGSFLRQGSTALVWLSGIHLGLIVALFWSLLWIGFLGTQIVEDGRFASAIVSESCERETGGEKED